MSDNWAGIKHNAKKTSLSAMAPRHILEWAPTFYLHWHECSYTHKEQERYPSVIRNGLRYILWQDHTNGGLDRNVCLRAMWGRWVVVHLYLLKGCLRFGLLTTWTTTPVQQHLSRYFFCLASLYSSSQTNIISCEWRPPFTLTSLWSRRTTLTDY